MKVRVPIPNTFFRLGLLTMILKVFLSFSGIVGDSYALDMVLSAAASGFFACSILQRSYPIKMLYLFACIVLLGILTSVRTGNLTIFIAIITCLATCGKDLDETIGFMLFWESLLVILTMLLSFVLHLAGFPMLTRVSDELRYNFGFSHPNVFSCIVTNLFAMYLWRRYDSLRLHQMLIICLTGLAISLITGSRTGLIVTLFLVVFSALFRNNRPHRFLRFMASCALPVLTVIFYWLCKGYISGNSLAKAVDKLISGRIHLGAYSLQRFGISLLGQDLSGVEVKWDEFWRLTSITFDNIYTYLLVTQFIWLLVAIVLFFRIAKKSDIKYCVFILAWALYGISEIHVMNPFLFFVILIVTSLFKRDRKEGSTCDMKPMG